MYTIVVIILLIAMTLLSAYFMGTGRTKIIQYSSFILSLIGLVIILLFLITGVSKTIAAQEIQREHKVFRHEIIRVRSTLIYNNSQHRWHMSHKQLQNIAGLMCELRKFNKKLAELKGLNRGPFDLFIPDRKANLKPLRFFR